MTDIIYPQLSYRIMGVLFKVHAELGNKYQEKYYQRAVAVALDKEKIKYIRELDVDLSYSGVSIGKYRLDFLIEKIIILELKTVPVIRSQDIKQVKAYLQAKKLKLGIIANFRSESLTYRRILNIN